MDNNKLETISNLFEGKEIRSIWNAEKEEYYFSVIDVVNALTESKNPRKYWSVLKIRLKKEGSELTTDCSQLKLTLKLTPSYAGGLGKLIVLDRVTKKPTRT